MRFKVRAARTLRETLRGADFIVLSIEPGPTEARYADLVVPTRPGIVQPLGDTAGPGGIARALRAIPPTWNLRSGSPGTARKRPHLPGWKLPTG